MDCNGLVFVLFFCIVISQCHNGLLFNIKNKNNNNNNFKKAVVQFSTLWSSVLFSHRCTKLVQFISLLIIKTRYTVCIVMTICKHKGWDRPAQIFFSKPFIEM